MAWKIKYNAQCTRRSAACLINQEDNDEPSERKDNHMTLASRLYSSRSTFQRSTVPMFNRALALCIVNCAFCIPLAAATYYASPTGSSSAACTMDAPGTIQRAINLTAARTSWETGDTVVLLPGTYDFFSAGSQTSPNNGGNCYVIVKNKAYVTIRSQSGDPSDTILKGRGWNTIVSPDLTTTNTPSLIRAMGINCNARIEGLTFTNFYGRSGGAVQGNGTANITLSNCILACNRVNYTGSYGGAIHQANAEDCVFLRNAIVSSSSDGGAAAGGANYTATRCLFEGNSSARWGGAIHKMNAVDCVFTNNTSSSAGGAARFQDKMTYRVTGCLFVGNHAGSDSGALSHYSASGTVSNCVFLRNSAESNSAAIQGGSATDVLALRNCILQENTTAKNCAFQFLDFYNCLIVSNKTMSTGSYGLCNGCAYRNCTVYGNTGAYNGVTTGRGSWNTIFLNNKPKDISHTAYNCTYATKAGTPTLTDCIATGNPGFNFDFNPEKPWFSLHPRSVARDKGRDIGWTARDADLAGKWRVYGSAVDIGCYEYIPLLPTMIRLH